MNSSTHKPNNHKDTRLEELEKRVSALEEKHERMPAASTLHKATEIPPGRSPYQEASD